MTCWNQKGVLVGLIGAALGAGCASQYTLPSPDGDGQTDGQEDDDDEGQEEDEDCEGPTLACGGECVEVSRSDEHCGACNVACAPGQSCFGGKCLSRCESGCSDLELCEDGVCQCRPGFSRCDGGCVDLRVAVEHCGACDNACEDAVCEEGECEGGCEQGTLCAGGCVDTDTHPAHCGGCGLICESDEVCLSGECEDYDRLECDRCPCDGACGTEACCESVYASGAFCADADSCF